MVMDPRSDHNVLVRLTTLVVDIEVPVTIPDRDADWLLTRIPALKGAIEMTVLTFLPSTMGVKVKVREEHDPK